MNWRDGYRMQTSPFGRAFYVVGTVVGAVLIASVIVLAVLAIVVGVVYAVRFLASLLG